MKTKHVLAASAAAFCVLTLLTTHVCATPPAYTVTILDYFGAAPVAGGSINNSGQIAFTLMAGPHIPYRLTGATLTPLPTTGGYSNFTTGINDSGQIIGSLEAPSGLGERAVRWTGTTRTLFGGLGGSVTRAHGINASGQVVGIASLAGDGAIHAVRWTAVAPTDLGTLGGANSYANAINASGQIAGWSEISAIHGHAVRWTGTTAEDLGTLGGNYSSANDINDSGQVVGEAQTGTPGVTHAVRWDGTTPTDLGTLGGTLSSATSINASGDIVGMSNTTDPNFHTAFLFSGGTMYNFLSLLDSGLGITKLHVTSADSINDHGQILLTAEFAGSPSGFPKLIRLDPIIVPEPTGAVLLLGGAALLGLRRRR